MRRYSEDEVEELDEMWGDWCQRFNMYSSVGMDQYALELCQKAYAGDHITKKELDKYGHILNKETDRKTLKAELYEFMKKDIESYDYIFNSLSELTIEQRVEMLEWYLFNYAEDEENEILLKAINEKVSLLKRTHGLI